MKQRLNVSMIAPEGLKAMSALEAYLHRCGLESSLLELVKIRASQINGCAYCLDMHTKDARARGETEQRIYLLSAWREASFYNEREKAALAYTEVLTQPAASHVSDEVYEMLCQQFSDKEIADLTLAIVAINGWNRILIAFRTEAGTYQPLKLRKAA